MTTRNGLDAAEQATVAAVERLGVPFDVLPCDPAHADTAAFCAAYGYPPERAANTIVVASKKEPKQYAACVVLATTRLDVNHAVRDLLGAAKCSFASAEEMRALTGMTVGGVTAFGLPDGPPDLRRRAGAGPRLGHPRHRGPQRQDPHLAGGVRPAAGGQGGGRARRAPEDPPGELIVAGSGNVLVVGRDQVVLDRRLGERRGRRDGQGLTEERRKSDRRRTAGARAELRARGFLIAQA